MEEPKHLFVLTKIVATLGPATSDVATIVQLIDAGARVFRINFSHGTFDEFENLLRRVREASDQVGRFVGVLGDLSGPKLRLGKVVKGGVMLDAGDLIRLTSEEIVAEFGNDPDDSKAAFSVNHKTFLNEVRVHERVLLDDGNLSLSCVRESSDSANPSILCKVIHGGQVTSAKGINLPDTDLSLPSLTDWDAQCVDFAVEKGFDYLALSFVRSGADIRVLKDRLRKLGARPEKPVKSADSKGFTFSAYGSGSKPFMPVVAKIEKPQALRALDEIVDESDVIMIARGDLGVEVELAAVPIHQKRIIRACHLHGKPAVIATQMLQSMIESPIPTRAEVSDVANAIFDGGDAVMLSGETAVGKYPLNAIRVMRKIASYTNEYRLNEKLEFNLPPAPRESRYRSRAVAVGVKSIVDELGAKLIILWTEEGGGASYLSQNKLPVPILAFSSNPLALRRMSILYGIVPRFMDRPGNTTDFIAGADSILIENQWAEKGDPIVMIHGEPFGKPGLTNKIRVHYVGEV